MKGLVKLVCSLRTRVTGLFIGTLVLLATMPARAAYTVVTEDGSGNITFAPSGMVTPIITGVVAAICAATALVVLWIGARWLYRALKGAK
ncbi:MAG TPA: hypothetical protein VHO48_09955 [Anaerolineaceae bacterium]|nr:hypothetical protein [Anaerolineaceae bacterium]